MNDGPKTNVSGVKNPGNWQPANRAKSDAEKKADAKRAAYENILGDTAASFNSSNAQTFRPQAGMDVANGTLPPGEVDMSQIASLMSGK